MLLGTRSRDGHQREIYFSHSLASTLLTQVILVIVLGKTVVLQIVIIFSLVLFSVYCINFD